MLPSRRFAIIWRSQLEQQRRATSGDGVLFHGQQHSGGMFHGTAVAEPRGQRDAARCLQWQITEVESNQSKAATFEKHVGGAQKLLQSILVFLRSSLGEPESRLGGSFFRLSLWRTFSTTHPQEAIQSHTCGRG